MRRLALVLSLLSSGCSRGVVVHAAPSAVVEVSLKVVNTAPQAVSIYVTANGIEVFLRAVAAGATEIVPVPGVATGTSVRLRAVLADGSRAFTRDGVTLSGVFEWQVP